MIALLCVLLQADDLSYVKRATREETRAASMEATLEDLPALRVEPWKRLDGRLQGGPKALGPSGAADLSAAPLLEGGARGRWQDGSDFADGSAREFRTATTWVRVLRAGEATDVEAVIGTGRKWDCWVNGEPVSLATHNSTHLLPSKRLAFRVPLRKGVNHLLVEVRGPSEIFFALSRLSPELRIALERRLDADFPEPSSEQFYYRLDALPFPKNAQMEVGGMAFAPDGTFLAATRRGEIWRLRDGAWSIFAAGLHEPLGLWADAAGDVAVVQRTELTRIRDTDGDGRADLFEALSQGWRNAAKPTAYAFGPLKDAEGNWIGALSASGTAGDGALPGWCFKVTPQGELVRWASGFRTPNGLGFDLAGELFVTDNQGEWVGTSPLYHVEKGRFYGHPGSLPSPLPPAEQERRRTLPAVQFPHGLMGRSPSQPLCDSTDGRFGPFAGQFFVGDQSSCVLMRVALEKVGGAWQGACFPFRAGFQSGNNRLAWAPDGSLWVGQTDRGFGAVGGRPFGLERVAWTGRVPFEIASMHATSDGFELRFTKPADRAAAASPAAYSVQHYHYLYHATYGSPQADPTAVDVRDVRVSDDGRRVTLHLGVLAERKVYELHVRGLKAADGAPLLHGEAYYTLNRRE